MTSSDSPLSLAWLRRDLRLRDNTALAKAGEDGQVVVLFVFDTTILDRLEDRDDLRVSFIHASLRELTRELESRGSCLLVRHGDPREEVPRVAALLGVRSVHAARDYEPGARARDEAVSSALRAQGIAFHTHKDQLIYHEDEILNGEGLPFRVFTPYKKAWLRRFTAPDHPPLFEIREQPSASVDFASTDLILPFVQPWELSDLGFTAHSGIPTPGEAGAEKRLRAFASRIARYHEDRDFPARDGTSQLSVDLRFGTMSIRRLVRLAVDESGDGAAMWLSELIWREFYAMILFHFPHVAHSAFRPEYRALPWPGTEEHFAAWCEGRTGYPIVDAGMRELRQTGRMPNRVRMITAMFLTKDLLVDWRRGEAWFARHLLDFDLASNNGGWQWSAGTGCDAQPWFRIFNPVLQSRRFDPEGDYIRRWVPELASLDASLIHWPHDSAHAPRHYPPPIVNHAERKALVTALFSSARHSG